MDITPVHIAKLVLGYLKAEKCQGAYVEFLKGCGDLKEFLPKEKRKHIATRYVGKTLKDILLDYSNVYTIVQEHLDDTDYYNSENYSNKLATQLVYLLRNKCPPSPTLSSRSSTPFDTDLATSKLIFNENLSLIEEEEAPNVNATPLQSLPGNNPPAATPKRKVKLPVIRSHRTGSAVKPSHKKDDKITEVDMEAEEKEEEPVKGSKINVDSVIQVFSQTILENEDLQEKIAQNINHLRNNESEKVEEHLGMDDIDNAIQAVLNKTESDPAFMMLMSEILDSVQNSDGAKVLPNKSITAEPTIAQSTIDDQNKVAVESIISACSSQVKNFSLLQPILPKTTSSCVPEKLTVNTAGPDVILFDGSFDTFMKDGNLNTPTAAVGGAPYIVNSTGLLMMKPSGQQPNRLQNNIVDGPLNPVQFVLSTPQLVNMIPQSQPSQKPILLTDKDILAMPMIVCGDKSNKKALLPPSTVVAPNKPANNAADFYNTYNGVESSQETMSNKPAPKVIRRARRAPARSKKTIKPTIIQVKILDTNDVDDPMEMEVPIHTAAIQETKITTPEIKIVKHVTTPRSENKSHVRALDFKFQTPAKEVIPVQTVENATPNKVQKSPQKTSKTVKTLFPSPTTVENPPSAVKPKCAASWDEELRILTGQGVGLSTRKSPKRKRVARKVTARAKSKPELNKTEDDARAIEKVLGELCSPDENKDTLNKSADAKEPEKPIIRTIKTPRKVTKRVFMKTPDDVKIGTPQDVVDMGLTLININAEPKYQKKCNIDNNTRSEVTVTRVKELQNLDVVANSEKLVLSPSKLNVNKRSVPEETEKTFLTPKVVKVSPQPAPVVAKRNIIPVLETPIKDQHPKTPGFLSPVSTLDTPFTKVFKEQLHGIDLTCIPTPQFPITPNFPFTPLLEQSPYSHRGTDYSTSSSYYQPSDTEQNKSLENMIMAECNRPELKKSSPLKPPRVVEIETQPAVEVKQSTAITQKLKSLSTNVIARKNLNLVKKPSMSSSDESSTSESESSESSEESSNSGSSWTEPNDTVIHKDTTEDVATSPPKTDNLATLRPKPATSPNLEKQIETTKNIIADLEYTPQLQNIPVIEDYQSIVLKEMEEKRKRTIEMFKTGGVSKPQPALKKKTPSKKAPTKSPAKKAPPKMVAPPTRRNLRSNSIRTPPKVVPEPSKSVETITSEPAEKKKPTPKKRVAKKKSPANKKPTTRARKTNISVEPENKSLEKEMEAIHADKPGADLMDTMEKWGFPLQPTERNRVELEDGEVLTDVEPSPKSKKKPSNKPSSPNTRTKPGSPNARANPVSPIYRKKYKDPSYFQHPRWMGKNRFSGGRFSPGRMSPNQQFRGQQRRHREPDRRGDRGDPKDIRERLVAMANGRFPRKKAVMQRNMFEGRFGSKESEDSMFDSGDSGQRRLGDNARRRSISEDGEVDRSEVVGNARRRSVSENSEDNFCVDNSRRRYIPDEVKTKAKEFVQKRLNERVRSVLDDSEHNVAAVRNYDQKRRVSRDNEPKRSASRDNEYNRFPSRDNSQVVKGNERRKSVSVDGEQKVSIVEDTTKSMLKGNGRRKSIADDSEEELPVANDDEEEMLNDNKRRISLAEYNELKRSIPKDIEQKKPPVQNNNRGTSDDSQPKCSVLENRDQKKVETLNDEQKTSSSKDNVQKRSRVRDNKRRKSVSEDMEKKPSQDNKLKITEDTREISQESATKKTALEDCDQKKTVQQANKQISGPKDIAQKKSRAKGVNRKISTSQDSELKELEGCELKKTVSSDYEASKLKVIEQKRSSSKGSQQKPLVPNDDDQKTSRTTGNKRRKSVSDDNEQKKSALENCEQKNPVNEASTSNRQQKKSVSKDKDQNRSKDDDQKPREDEQIASLLKDNEQTASVSKGNERKITASKKTAPKETAQKRAKPKETERAKKGKTLGSPTSKGTQLEMKEGLGITTLNQPVLPKNRKKHDTLKNEIELAKSTEAAAFLQKQDHAAFLKEHDAFLEEHEPVLVHKQSVEEQEQVLIRKEQAAICEEQKIQTPREEEAKLEKQSYLEDQKRATLREAAIVKEQEALRQQQQLSNQHELPRTMVQTTGAIYNPAFHIEQSEELESDEDEETYCSTRTFEQEDEIAYHDENYPSKLETVCDLSKKSIHFLLGEDETEVATTLHVTPFISILDIPEKVSLAVQQKQRKPITILENITIPVGDKTTAKSIIKSECEEIIKGNDDGAETSLENLHEPTGSKDLKKGLGKRMADTEPEKSDVKKAKPQDCTELLKDMNVDEFLMKLHGDL